jgi:hypothetical protein
VNEGGRIRRYFFGALFRMLGIVWPILSGVLLLMIGPGLAIGFLEGWSVGDSVYFTFVTGLTIGYGDLIPHRALSRVLAAVIGLSGILLTGLVAAVVVEALRETVRDARMRR